ncbi:MATE family efflux transporter [candidate division WOR_3 bacterium SM23_42]|uniref:MATE family efflux transporter n=1 Tax=candidate division WOR_3 bacterium SM23_42 TaxID=1703779 RepID=A0A0S8FXG4_UNCW3|nr:MAG: MATE family efflux transporter [candidate division WOR_3 bacterium SM23_42]
MKNKNNPVPKAQLSETEGVKTLLGNPKKAIIRLAVPMIVAMSVQTIYSFVDAIWVSGLGPDALSAVGFFFPFFFMIIALSTGLGVGGAAAISRRIGAGDRRGADNVAAHTMVMMLFVSAVITIPFFFLANTIFSRMGAGRVAPLAASYAQVIFIGTILIFFTHVASALLRAEGDVRRAMYAGMGGAGLNIILDPIFIYTLRLGVAGAAWASVISMFIASSVLFYWVCIKQDTYVAITLKSFRFNRDISRDILRVGLPASIMQIAMAFSVFLLNLIAVRVAGTDGVAVYTTGWRVAMFAALPLLGMATAVTSVTGAAFGARDYAKLDKAYMYAIRIGVYIELAVASLTFILAPQITSLFTMSQEAARIADDLIIFIRTMCIYYPAAAFGILSSAMFQGIGKGINSLAVTIFRTIVLVIPLVYFFSISLHMRLPGIWWGIVMGNIIGATIAFSWARYIINRLRI